jgi:DNA-methyltransferase (dcm)
VRIRVEDQDGHRGHRMLDAADEPMPAVVAGRPVEIEVEAGPGPRRRRRDRDKPPYRVPSMAEVAAVPWNGLAVASTFAGCGGSCLGYRMAGYRILWANEFEANAAAAYRDNAAPGTVLDRRDVRHVRPEEVLEACGLEPGGLDLLDGSPPCQSFSMAGQRARSWGRVMAHSDGTTQRSDDLFGEYVRLLRGLRPRAFVAENVAGMTAGVAKGHFLEVLRELRASGYRVRAKVLDAQWLGVPQRRARLILVGVRDDLGPDPAFPAPLPYRYTLRDALPWVGRVVERTGGDFSRRPLDGGEPAHTVLSGGAGHWTVEGGAGRVIVDAKRPGQPAQDVTDRPGPTVTAGGAGSWTVEPEAWLAGDVAERWDRLGAGGQDRERFNLVRPDPDRPAPTMAAAWGSSATLAVATHPTERRKFSIAELRRVCSFPDDFSLPGTYAQQWARLGNSVPPLMARAVGEALRDRVLLLSRGGGG